MAFIPASHKVGDIVTCMATGKRGIITAIYQVDLGYTVSQRVIISYTVH